MIYLDSSAVVKLVRREPGTGELQAFLAEHSPDALVSSALVDVEVPRALRQSAPNALPYVGTTLQLLHRLAIDEPVRAQAADFADPGLRSLNAIHPGNRTRTAPGDRRTDPLRRV